jgi:xylan 1,4-beta-xylosidase
VRLTNFHTPGGGTFSVRDLRIFGGCPGSPPAAPARFEAHRDASDPRGAVLRWDLVPGAEGYVIRYGVAPGKLYRSHEVRGHREITLHNLNTAVPYYFTIDAFNESGLTAGTVNQKI